MSCDVATRDGAVHLAALRQIFFNADGTKGTRVDGLQVVDERRRFRW